MDSTQKRLLDSSAEVVRKRVVDFADRVKRLPATDIGIQYAKSVATAEDRVIQVQAEKLLPRDYVEYAGIALRDEGNALIEETRQINNRYAGKSIHEMEAWLFGDLEVIDLSYRVLNWVERSVDSICYKLRRKFKDEPLPTYLGLYSNLIHYIDTKIAHGIDHMYSLIWGNALDAFPFLFIDRLFLQPRLFYGEFLKGQDPEFVLKGDFIGANKEVFALSQHLTLYGYASTVYARQEVLEPLLNHLKTEEKLPSQEEMRLKIRGYVNDLLEAFPYIAKSTRVGKHLFRLPGRENVAAFDFTATKGFARIFLSDNEDRFAREIVLGKGQSFLEISFEGEIAIYPQLWMTLERVFGAEDATALTYWLLKQSHELVLASYLKINAAYMAPAPTNQDEVVEELPVGADCAEYTEWMREALVDEPGDDAEGEIASLSYPITQLPQMRRSRLFKLLENCGVSIAQGKGSELKLLRKDAHPFRLGCHYGPNPTVPSFLIALILKRLQITRNEWQQAIAELRIAGS